MILAQAAATSGDDIRPSQSKICEVNKKIKEAYGFSNG
jgi:hypothetical protein